jgi:hypothetical protein
MIVSSYIDLLNLYACSLPDAMLEAVSVPLHSSPYPDPSLIFPCIRTQAWTQTPEEVLSYFSSSSKSGLSDKQVKLNEEAYGLNGTSSLSF